MRTLEIQNGGQKETYTFDKYAQSSDIGIMQKIGGTVILCTICVDYNNPINENFVPLNVQYIEKMYAIGKIPQGYIKKEGKPSESEILVSRLIDRSLRPLFPKYFLYPVQINLLVLSYDGKSDVYKDALNLASISLFCSSIPICYEYVPNGVRIVKHEDLISICNDFTSLQNSSLDLFVSGVYDNDDIAKITMIEMQALKTYEKQENLETIDNDNLQEYSNEISKELLLESTLLARKYIAKISKLYAQLLEPFCNTKHILTYECNSNLKQKISNDFGTQIKQHLIADSKSERKTALSKLASDIVRYYDLPDDEESYNKIESCIDAIKKDIMRNMIIKENIRIDGRAPTQIRPISIESNPLPLAHGSACFTRGQTQALVTCTLGHQNEAKATDIFITQKKARILFHYNFPPFCVGEASHIGASSRREIGHGNLALKAIESNIKNNTSTIRIVSEILQSNGSSSMASVCGATLAMLGANVAMNNMVAGIAMGIVHDDINYVILSDIVGLEDHYGDMDLKVAGNKKGFSAIQLDIKNICITQEILSMALQQAQDGLYEILESMSAVNIIPNYDLLPQRLDFTINPIRIPDIIGQGGRTIRDIIAKFKINIDFNKEKGIVILYGQSQRSLNEAKEYINEILKKKERKDIHKQDM
ncbi:polyribonucleotide nucleotidyltransferase [Helicobacter muridarum]|uniref:Polyribonucleotide nucleotidyltransferase n=1 Tax=Helicobacter muridarum TaxID=216 RepID=A0A377PTR8_9HELI|nr:polyribonucleotide nucleotidyltransferase [Helicobacter muridarum]TLE00315.1 polyribonucleotide nucleotidyltransferase [Helicobacter muridarum]STQ85812.1 polynucleotide phosphorylase/polyadenylase [Helicobacter muridarum]